MAFQYKLKDLRLSFSYQFQNNLLNILREEKKEDKEDINLQVNKDKVFIFVYSW